MFHPAFPCIVYTRVRESEPRANHFALLQQDESERAVGLMGYDVVGRFGDSEFAPPFCGYLEPRPAWYRALAAAVDHALHHERCALIVLRPDGIGSGDPFLPDLALLQEYPGLDIRLCQFSLRGHAPSVNLRDAHRRFELFASAEGQHQLGEFIDLGGATSSGEILLRHDTPKGLVRAYYANFRDHPVEVQWSSYSRKLGVTDQWAQLVERRGLRIPARQAIYLESVIQGHPEPKARVKTQSAS